MSPKATEITGIGRARGRAAQRAAALCQGTFHRTVAAMRWIPLLGLLLSAAPTLAAEPVWTVQMFQKGAENRVSVESGTLFVDFLEKHAWTIRNIRYEGDEIVGEHGANGSVVSATPEPDAASQDTWIGTGHGKEIVHSWTILVDGAEQPYEPGSTFTGEKVVIRKTSNMGPLDHESEFVFPPSGDRIIERHAYKVAEDLDRRFNFVYAFMHCNSNALDSWLAVTEGGEELRGQVGKADNSFSLRQDARSVTFYSTALQKGVVYAYAEPYEGAEGFHNSIWDRKRDNKLYFKPKIPSQLGVGDRFDFQLQVIPFSATPEEWTTRAKAISSAALR